MSGICGVIHFDGAPLNPQVLTSMAASAAHRGPDGIDCWIDEHAGLAHLALRVTHESQREAQPLVWRHLALVADARLDNRAELINILRAKGLLKDKDPTDADLLLASYRLWNTNCAEHLLGDFAFAIWDEEKKQLFAVRDPMAMRAFYFRHEPKRFLFGTEVKQILAAPGVPARIFEPAVAAHLLGSDDNLEWTYYEGINQLAPAHALLADTTGYRTWRYWDIDIDVRIQYANEESYIEHFKELFKEAVKCRLRSIKPAGISLSGGMDSGSIASTVGWLHQNSTADELPSLHVYSHAFHELKQCDERHISDEILHHYGFPATYVVAENAYPLKSYPDHGPDRDEPWISHYQALVDAILSAARADGIGVMLYGMRGDLTMGVEIYDYLDLLRVARWRTLWRDLNEHHHFSGIGRTKLVKTFIGEPLKDMLLCQFGSHWIIRRLLNETPFPSWIRTDFVQRTGVSDLPQGVMKRPTRWEYSRSERYMSVFSPIVMQGAKWMERNNARFGVSFADPWSDLRIISFSVAVPQRLLNRAGEKKRLTRQAMKDIMPEKARQASRKIYPGPLYDRALREWALPTVLKLMRNSQAAARGYIDEQALRAYYDSFLNGGPEDHLLWRTLTLEMWLRQYWR